MADFGICSINQADCSLPMLKSRNAITMIENRQFMVTNINNFFRSTHMNQTKHLNGDKRSS